MIAKKSGRLILIVMLNISYYTIGLEVEIISLLPDTTQNQHLKLLKKPAVYEGNDLFTIIDGGAEIYFEYGFTRAADVAYLENETARIDIQIYEMSDEGAAYGIFSNSFSDSDRIIHTDLLMITHDQYAMFYKNRYFGVISYSNTDQHEIR